MPSVYKRGGRWYLRYKDECGHWRKQVSQARTKTEARRLADELERRCERQRLGLEPLPEDDTGMTVAELLRWWLDTYSVDTASHESTRIMVERHLLTAELAERPIAQLTSGDVETLLQAKGRELAPASVNHLRKFLSSAFNAGIRAGKCTVNPVRDVRKRRVPKRAPDYLRAHEVPAVLSALDRRWRPLFATAIYAGLRKGELFGLRKRDVDLEARLLTVAQSHGRDTTKGGRAETIPIAAELVPYLAEALRVSTCALVFPGPGGRRYRKDTKLTHVLRRALGRADIATGYTHVCRRKGCGHKEESAERAIRRCPKDGAKLWPKPHVRPIRFHDLRHTTASLLMQAGASPAAVQRIMRHSDPRITTEVYGHLAPEYLRSEIDRLSFVPSVSQVEDDDPSMASGES